MSHSSLRSFLFISFTINILFLGVLLGAVSYYLGIFSLPQALIASLDTPVYQSLAKLPAEKRTLIESTLASVRKDIEEGHKQMDKSRAQGFNLLEKEPFDEKAFLSQTQHAYDDHVRARNAMNQKIAATASQLNADERSLFVSILSHPPFSPPARPLLLK